jgi:L-ribulose-5-phosphate 3-epimerase
MARDMKTTRREFITRTSLGLSWTAFLKLKSSIALTKSNKVRFNIGAPDWNLGQEAKVESIGLARKLGFDGVQISLGIGKDALPLSDPSTQKNFLSEAKRVGLPLASVCINALHRNILKSDALGQRWVADAIGIAKNLGVKVILLPFFGRGALKSRAEMEYVGDVLREIGPAAEKAGVILGLEDTISARDNVLIMERARSRAVLVYYDVGNSTENGFDILKEIRWLGRERICEVHLKDNPHYLGEGKIDLAAVINTLADIGFDQWAQLECDSPTGRIEDDMARNLKYVRGIVSERNR